MTKKLGFGKATGWQGLVSPLLMLVCLYFMSRFAFSGDPLFTKPVLDWGYQSLGPDYRASGRLVGMIVSFSLFNIFFFYSLWRWARYFLDRKLYLSYFFFGFSLVTVLVIFGAVIRAWFGITTTIAMERNLELNRMELENFVSSIHAGIRDLSLSSDMGEEIRRMIDSGRRNELIRQRHLRIPLEIYWQSEKVAGHPRILASMYFSDKVEESERDNILNEDTEPYEQVYPVWIRDEKMTHIVNEDGELFIRHFSVAEHAGGNRIVITAASPIDHNFFSQLKSYVAADISMTNLDGTTFVESVDSAWYMNLVFKPFSTSWDVMAMEWTSGSYKDYGNVVFEFGVSGFLDNWDRAALPFFFQDQKNATLRFIFGITLILVLGQVVALGFGFYLIRYITRSLNIIAEGHEEIAGGRLAYRLPHIGKDQLGSMGRSFNSMVGNIESLMTEVAEKEKFHEELRIARDIQMSLLPNVEQLDWCHDIAAVCIPAREVGGDYYEVLNVDENRVGLFIADVSGKGTSAAFYMAELKGVLLAMRHLWDKPRELMLGINEVLEPALAKNVFVSGAYLLIDRQARSGKLARAGHCPSFHLKSDGTVHELMPPGMALGIAKNKVFGRILEVQSFEAEAGDKVVLYTDGLDEMTFHNEMYGLDRLKSVLSKSADLDEYGLKDAILTDVLDFLSSESQNDDLTLVVASFPAPDTPPT